MNGRSIISKCKLLQSNTKRIFCHYSIKNAIEKSQIKTAGIIVIGDEILKGDVLDTNSNYAMKILYKLGVNVKKVSIIGDDVDAIAAEVTDFSTKFDYVLTTGGIGPTHDDVTFDGIAKAFNVELEANQYLVKLCQNFYKTCDLKAPGMKLAFIPQTAKLIFYDSQTSKKNYPNVSVKNIFIFPGIPELFRKSIDGLGEKVFATENKFFTKNIYLNVNEQMVVDVLEKLVKEYPKVRFGSYPAMNSPDYKVRIKIESTNENLTSEAARKVEDSFPKVVVTKIQLPS